MNLEFCRGTVSDIDLLTETRIEVLRAANRLDDSADLSEVKIESRAYYCEALREGSHAAFLAFDEEVFAGAGGISFYRVMPTCSNPSGFKAYIMNMYTRPDYRRRGVARRMLELLVGEAKKRGIDHITLEATAMGRSLYEAFGFVAMKDEMLLPQSCLESR